MSEQEAKKERSTVEIQSEYQLLCAKAGHLQYSIGVMNKDIERINSVLLDLNNEHHKAKAKEQEQPKLEAVPSEEEVKS